MHNITNKSMRSTGITCTIEIRQGDHLYQGSECMELRMRGMNMFLHQHSVHFRTAFVDDAAELLEIYRYYVEETAVTFEWETPSVDEFKDRIRHTLERYPYIVAEANGRILGYTCAGAFKNRKAYDWSVETTIYLDHTIRHQGIGRQLYSKLEQALKQMNVLNLNACIAFPREKDACLTDDSARFHEHLGYTAVGKFHDCGYKFGRWYDMIWMEKMIGEHTHSPAEIIPYRDLPMSSGYGRGDKHDVSIYDVQ